MLTDILMYEARFPCKNCPASMSGNDHDYNACHSGALTWHLQGIFNLTGCWGHLGVSWDDLQMPCRCPVDAFPWRGTSQAPAGHQQGTCIASIGAYGRCPSILVPWKIGLCPKNYNSVLKVPSKSPMPSRHAKISWWPWWSQPDPPSACHIFQNMLISQAPNP